MDQRKLAVLKILVDTLVDTIKESGAMGAPGGVLYAALMTKGFSLEEFEILMRVVVATGRVYKTGHLYFAK